ncbi:MAG: T9SS type A sorting domain-containing protein [Bacteroidetes bacterium]|nr:T9SS type A sorting domain-containing protein [Bacteroidota bacterium]
MIKFIPKDTISLIHHWSFGDGLADAKIVKPYHVYMQDGDYTIVHQLYSSDSCFNADSITIKIVLNGLSAIGHLEKEVLSVFPNPIQPDSRIEYTINSNEHITFTLFDQLGKCFSQKVVHQSRGAYRITLNEIFPLEEAGIYMLVMQTNAGLQSFKIIKY